MIPTLLQISFCQNLVQFIPQINKYIFFFTSFQNFDKIITCILNIFYLSDLILIFVYYISQFPLFFFIFMLYINNLAFLLIYLRLQIIQIIPLHPNLLLYILQAKQQLGIITL